MICYNQDSYIDINYKYSINNLKGRGKVFHHKLKGMKYNNKYQF